MKTLPHASIIIVRQATTADKGLGAPCCRRTAAHACRISILARGQIFTGAERCVRAVVRSNSTAVTSGRPGRAVIQADARALAQLLKPAMSERAAAWSSAV